MIEEDHSDYQQQQPYHHHHLQSIISISVCAPKQHIPHSLTHTTPPSLSSSPHPNSLNQSLTLQPNNTTTTTMRWWAWAWACVVGVVFLMHAADSSRILVISPIASKSHINFYMGIINAMADRGHQITVLTPYKTSKLHQNVSEVVLPDMELSKFTPNLFTGGKMVGPLTLARNTPYMCSDALGHPKTQALLTQKYDLIMLSMFFSDCFLSVVHRLKVPYVNLAPAALHGPFAKQAGDIQYPSFVSNLFFTFKHPYTFTQRLILAAIDLFGDVVFSSYITHRMEEECRGRGLCPEDMPSLKEMRLNASLTLINSIKTLEVPTKPSVPTTIYCGGIHCHPPKPLPQDLAEWVAGAGEDGFIYFSLGSAVTPSSMPEQYRKVLVEVFGSLKQRVLWKWDKDTMEDLPPNVRLGKWLPQQDILGDPRMRLFITHGGLLSTLECLYHGVPVLGMPVFADQHTNMFEVQENGWGRVLHWQDLTPQTLRQKIFEVMNDKSMREEVQRRSLIMKDQVQKPEDVASFWLEYVMRHHGAPHLVSPVRTLYWYELYNVDVWITLLIIVTYIPYISFKLLRFLCRRFVCGNKKQKSD